MYYRFLARRGTMPPSDSSPAVPRSDTLALLYQNILTGIVRIQAGRQPLTDVETFRRRMRAALQEVEREASAAGYGSAEFRDAEFAVVAFLDEGILSSKEPKAEEWRKKPLNIELFGQAVAGDVFFDKLLEIERRRDSAQLADLLEVYLMCLLLGFEGRFAPPLRGEAFRIMERLRSRIQSIRGGMDFKLSPPMEFHTETPVTPPASGDWRWWVLGAIAGVLLLFLVYKWSLSWRTEQESFTSRPEVACTATTS
jgi:type VI secretion system protein ImpK